MLPQYTHDFIERFWAKVNFHGPTQAHCPELGPCWVWEAAISAQGYGAVRQRGETFRTHCVVWGMVFGPLVRGDVVQHRCDYRPCVKPSHLTKGTNASNSADMVAKGRSLRGVLQPQSRLDEPSVLEMRSLFDGGSISVRALARMFRTGYSTAYRIVHRESWTHLP